MSFGMEKDEIISKVKKELGKPRGGLLAFDDFQKDAIAEAIAIVVTKNNTRIMDTLEEADIDF